MNETAVVYKSKYGATRQYAQWLSLMAKTDLLEHKAASAKTLARYKKIVYAGALYAGSVNGLGSFANAVGGLKGIKLAIAVVGAGGEDQLATLGEKLPPELKSARLFYLRGDWPMSRMNVKDRMMIGMLKKMLKSKKAASDNGGLTQLLIAGADASWLDRDSLSPIIGWIAE